MKSIQDSRFCDSNKSILQVEFEQFKKQLKTHDANLPFYTYALCYPNGTPFYIGKGKGNRAWAHFKNFVNNKMLNRYMKEVFSSLIDPPIMFIMHSNLTEQQALDLEEYYISQYGRKLEHGILCNVLPHGKDMVNAHTVCSFAGKIGGKNTKNNKSGIFSESYDRASESKRRWKTGILSQENFNGYSHCSAAGQKTKDSKKGIFDPLYDRSTANKKVWDSLSDEERSIRIEKFKQTGRDISKIPLWTNGVEH